METEFVSKFHGRSFSYKSSLYIDGIPRRFNDSVLKAWRAEEILGGTEVGRDGERQRKRRKSEEKIKLFDSGTTTFLTLLIISGFTFTVFKPYLFNFGDSTNTYIYTFIYREVKFRAKSMGSITAPWGTFFF